MTREQRKGQYVPEEGGKPLRAREPVWLRLQVRVHHAYQGGTLAGKILQSQQGNTAERFCPHHGFHFRPVALQGIFARGADHLRPEVFQSGFMHSLFHVHQVGRYGNAAVVPDLPEVGEHLVLPDFEREDRLA